MINKNMQQQPNTSGDKSAAALAFATMLSEGLMPKVQPEEGQTFDIDEKTSSEILPETTPTEEISSKDEEMAMNDKNETKMAEMETKMEKMKAEIEAMVKEEISSIKDMIIEALQNEEE